MIEPNDRVVDCAYGGGRIGLRWPAYDDDFDAERPRRGDLAVGGAAAAVLGDDDANPVRRHQRVVIGFDETGRAR